MIYISKINIVYRLFVLKRYQYYNLHFVETFAWQKAINAVLQSHGFSSLEMDWYLILENGYL